MIQTKGSTAEYLGIVSDRSLLSWFAQYVGGSPSFRAFLKNTLNTHALPSINIYDSIISANSNDAVLDAMKLMSEEGVSSVAVLDEETRYLLSAVSVTDVGKVSSPRVLWVTFN